MRHFTGESPTGCYEATVERHQFTAGGLLDVTLPAPTRAVASAQHFDGKTCFQAKIPAPGVKAEKRPLSKRVALLWDASGSGPTATMPGNSPSSTAISRPWAAAP